MAKKVNNFRKFGKLVRVVKKIADENPEIKKEILDLAETSSNNSWNKIQSFTSKTLFQSLKEKPLRFFTKKNIEKEINDKIGAGKKQKCFDVFKVPTADLGVIEPFDLENVLASLPKNLQVQIDLTGGSAVNTGIVQIQEINGLGTGSLTTGIRNMFVVSSDIDQIKFARLRKKGAKPNDKNNCAYYIKAMFLDDVLTPDEADREVVVGISLKDLTKKEKEERLRLKKQIDKDFKTIKSQQKAKDFKKPKKVIDKKEDKEIQKKIKANERLTEEEAKAFKFQEFNKAVENLRSLLDDGLITKKQFQSSFNKLGRNLKKGGEI